MVLFCILLHVIPLPVVAVMRSGSCKHVHQWNLIFKVSPRLAVFMAPHAEDNILVVLLLLLFSSLFATLVFFVFAPVFFSLTLIWFSRIRSLLENIYFGKSFFVVYYRLSCVRSFLLLPISACSCFSLERGSVSKQNSKTLPCLHPFSFQCFFFSMC